MSAYVVIVTEREHRKNGRYLVRSWARPCESYEDMDGYCQRLKARTTRTHNMLSARPHSFDYEVWNLKTTQASRAGTTAPFISC